MSLLWTVLASMAALVSFAISPGIAHAGNITWPQETDLFMSGSNINLKINAGSQADTLVVNPTTFTVTVAAGETFTVRYPGPNPGRLANDSGYAECNFVGNDIQVAVTGPATVTFTPNATACVAAGGGGGSFPSPPALSVTVSSPNGGETLQINQTWPIAWSATGSGISGVKILLSTDSGTTFPTVIVANTPNDGSHSWLVPSMSTTSRARVKVEALDSNSAVLTSDTSNADFTIQGTAPQPSPPPPPGEPPSTDPTATGVYDPAVALAATPSIDVDKGLTGPTVPVPQCSAGSLIKLPNDNDPTTFGDTTVFYCGKDGRRYAFPNQRVYFSWYPDFSGVLTVSPAVMGSIPLAGNVTYRPGKKMIKVQTDPKVYAISRGGLLRHITSEAIAAQLYGTDWNKKIDYIVDAFFVNYRLGEPITAEDVP